MNKIVIGIAVGFILSACGTQPMAPSVLHLSATPPTSGKIPEPVAQSASVSPPKPSVPQETYSISVYKVPVQSLLFALARDAKVNIDIHPGVTGEVTLNALNQTLPNILNRITRQVDMRYELDGANLTIVPDTPYLKNYKIDYVNITRHTTGMVNIATQISSAGGAPGGAGGGAGGAANNNSTTSVENKSNNDFWVTLVRNVSDILRESDKLVPGQTNQPAASTTTATDSSQASPAASAAPAATPPSAATTAAPAQAAPVAVANNRTGATGIPGKTTFRETGSVTANPENGVLAVRATSRQHERIQEFLDLVMASAKRQVMIEATVVEVQLSDQYQQGINWSSINKGNTSTTSITQGQVNNVALSSGVSPGTTAGLFVMNYTNPTSILGNISATVQLLESFGKVKVVSSPKISVLNNQSALLKVVDNNVYFTITATTTAGSLGATPVTTYTSTLNTVPVGFVMSVTAQITDNDEVTLNVRPSISRIIGYVQDPNPALATASPPVVSNVPIIQSREMESILKVTSGQIAVMGGLMQDEVNNNKDSVPVLSTLPLIGNAFNYRNETASKSELVIFLRPVVLKDADINGDYKEFRNSLPTNAPFNQKPYGDDQSKTSPANSPGVVAESRGGS